MTRNNTFCERTISKIVNHISKSDNNMSTQHFKAPLITLLVLKSCPVQ